MSASIIHVRPGKVGGGESEAGSPDPFNAIVDVLDTLDLPIVVVRRDCVIVRYNRAAADVLGLTSSDIGRLSLCGSGALKDVKELEKLCAQVFDEAVPYRREVKIGDRRFILRLAPFFGANGQMEHAVLTCTNVTAFRESIGQAIYEREYTKAILNTVSEPLTVLDVNLRVQTANRAFYDMIGLSREETQGIPLGELKNAKWLDAELWTSLREVLSDNREFVTREVDCEFQTIGHRTLLLDARRLSRNEHDMILLVFQDITERKQAEEALRASEERHRTVLGLMHAAVYTCEAPSGIITFYNDHAAKLWGRAPKLGDSDERFCGAHKLWLPDGTRLPHDQTPMMGAILENRSYRGLEVIIERPDGSRITVLVNIDPIHNANGEVVGVINVFHDMTALKQAEQQLREADRRKDEFLATLAHELRNPLAPIRNSLQILRMSERASPAAEQVYEIMERQVAHMVRLVDDLLELSRISSGKIELKKERLELASVIGHALETSKPFIEAGGHRLEVLLPNEAVILDGDLVRLSQIFANLLNNAAKYTQNSGSITIEAKREETAVVVSIRDTGIGIPRDMLLCVFDMFAQVDNVLHRSKDGLGIGLHLVRTLAVMHGGSVEARSDGLGLGSEFVVRLPLAEQQGLGIANSIPQKSRNPSNGPTRRILLVDDNRDAADSFGTLLKFLGADVKVVYDGQSALEALRICRPSVLILDIGMPGLDGYEVARQVRRDARFCDVVLIALTGWGQEEDRRRTREAGFDYHLVKPVEINALQEILSSLESRIDTTGEMSRGTSPADA